MSGAAPERPLPSPTGPARRPDRRWVWWLVLGCALLFAIACRDMQFAPDSIHYTDVARTLLREHTAATWHLTLNSERVPDPKLYWPPGYPLMLAAVMATGASVQTAAWVVAVLCWSAVLGLLVFWQRHAEWGLLGAVAFIYMLFAWGIAFRAWSEAPYSAFMLGALVCMAAAIGSGDTWRATWLGLIAGVLAGGAAMCRYPGIIIVPALALAALIVPLKRDDAWSLRWSALVPMLGAAALIVVPWIARTISLAGVAFGPARPPSDRSLSWVLGALGSSLYLDFGAVLLALLFAIVGFHRAPREPQVEGAESHPLFLHALAIAALLCALAQSGLLVLSQLAWQIDEPPSQRYLFPAYLCVVVAALAVIGRTRPPAHVLRRRWPSVLALALPLVLAPLAAARFAHDVTPQRTALDDWIAANTSPRALIIGHRAWPVRFYTGRPVLESGQVADPPVFDGVLVAQFLRKFGDRFDGVYLLLPDTIPEEITRDIVDRYQNSGLHLEDVAQVSTRDHESPSEFVMRIYRVKARGMWSN